MTESLEPKTAEAERRSSRRVWIIVVLTVALALLVFVIGGVGAVSGLLANGDLGLTRRVVALANGMLGSETTQFSFDRVSGTIFQGAVLEHPRLIVRAPGKDATWAEAKRLSVEYDLWSLLTSSRRSFSARFDSLTILLARDSTGALVMPRFHRGRASKSPVHLDLSLSIRGASVILEREGVVISRLDGSGRVTIAGAASTVMVEGLSGIASGADASSPLRLSGLITLQDSSWRLDPFELDLTTTRVRGAAEWDPDRGRVREGILRLQPLDLTEALPLVDVEGVTGSVRGDVTFSGLPTDGMASGCLEGTIAGEAIDTLVVEAAFARTGVRVERLQTRLRGAVVYGTGSIEPGGALEAVLQFANADPANLPWWKAPAGMPTGSLAGEAELRIARARPRPFVRVAGTVTSSRVARLPIEGATFLVHAPPAGGLVLDSLALRTPGATLNGAGTIDPRGALSASATAVIHDLGRMGEILAPVAPQGGRGRLAITLGGTLEQPTMTARAGLASPRTESGLRSDSVVVAASGPLAPALDLRGWVRVQGLEAGTRPLGNVRAVFSGGRPLRVEEFVETLGDTTLSLAGTISFEDGGVRAVVDSLRLGAGTIRASTTRGTSVTYVGGRLRASPVTLDLAPGRMELDVDWNVTGRRLDLRGVVESLDLARISRRSDPAVSGMLRAQFMISGPAEDPGVSLHGTIVAPRLGGVQADSLSARLEYAPGVLTVESLSWRRGPSGAVLRGTLRPRIPLGEWLKEVGRGERGWTSQTALALEADADSFDLAALAPVDTAWATLSGSVSFHARVGGTVAAPTASVAGRGPHVHFRAFDGAIAAAELDYRDRALGISRFEFVQGSSRSTASGRIPLDLTPFAKERWRRDDPLRLSIRMNEADISIFPALSSLVAASSGKLSGEAEVSGTPRKPKATGSLRLRDGRLRFSGRYEILEDLTADGVFNEGELTLSQIAARQGKRGRISGSGIWRWAEATAVLPPGSVGPPGDYELTLKASDCVATDREYYIFQFSGSFVVKNARTAAGVVKPRITGNAVVSRGDLTMNLATPAGEPPPPLPFLYDVTVEFPRQLTYRQLDTEVDLAGTLQMRNEGDRDIALGTLTVKGGQFYFLTRKFQNLTGEVNFNNPERLDPDVAIDASTRIRRESKDDHVVNLAVTGRASQLQIRPWDEADPPTSPSDLWRELSVGQFSSAQSQDVTPGGDPLAGVGLGSLPIRDYLFRNAERWIAGSGFIDTIDLRSGAGSGGDTKNTGGPIDLGTVGIGKYVTRDLFLKYSRDFSGQSEDRISAEYRVTRHLLLRGQYVQPNSTGGSTLAAQEYNLDLKIRVEY